jgi:hypothetical protein
MTLQSIPSEFPNIPVWVKFSFLFYQWTLAEDYTQKTANLDQVLPIGIRKIAAADVCIAELLELDGLRFDVEAVTDQEQSRLLLRVLPVVLVGAQQLTRIPARELRLQLQHPGWRIPTSDPRLYLAAPRLSSSWQTRSRVFWGKDQVFAISPTLITTPLAP